MPSIVTHHLFSDDVLTSVKKSIQEKINSELSTYHIFAQSFDNLFYYNLLTLKKGREIRSFGTTAQRINIQDYFKNILLTIKEKNLQDNPEVCAYLYGSLTHYLLDSTCHPFIIYNAGWCDDEAKTRKYRGNHEKIEVMIDRIYLKEKRNLNLHQAKLADLLLPKIKFSKELKEVMDITFDKTFHKKNMAKIYEKSANQGHYILKYFVTDHTGIKKFAYKIYDGIFKKGTKYEYLSFYVKHMDKSVLNREKKTWCNPIDKKIQSNQSFDELYQEAKEKAVKIFNDTEKVLQNKMNIHDYLREIKNNSYATGLEWTRSDVPQFFKN